jgi:hypothetical protein
MNLKENKFCWVKFKDDFDNDFYEKLTIIKLNENQVILGYKG